MEMSIVWTAAAGWLVLSIPVSLTLGALMAFGRPTDAALVAPAVVLDGAA
jgi:hypothetical protein